MPDMSDMGRTAESWASWGSFGRSTGGSTFFKSKKQGDMMANTAESWHSFGSWGGNTFMNLKDAVWDRTSVHAGRRIVTRQMLLDCFHEIDKAGDGRIRPKQLYKAFRRCGLKVSKSAMRAVMRDMDVDDSQGLYPDDFVMFFRRAEELTLETENQGPSGCTHRFFFCFLLSALATCCVFMILLILKLDGGNEAKRIGFSTGAVISGAAVFFCFCIGVCIPICSMKAPGIAGLSTAIANKRKRVPKDLNASYAKRPRCEPTKVFVQPRLDESYRPNQRDGEALPNRDGTYWKRRAEALRESTRPELHAWAIPGLPDEEQGYDPSAYNSAVNLQECARGFNALQVLGHQNTQMLDNMPSRPGAALKGENFDPAAKSAQERHEVNVARDALREALHGKRDKAKKRAGMRF